jgi:DNA polymerase epsilon subunit 2
LRPVAVRIFTRNHNLNLKSSALSSLATFIGRYCGAGWREEGLAERVLEEVARTWKRLGGPVIVDGEGEMMKNILKSLESSMVGGRIVQSKAPTPSLSREGSFKFGPQNSQGSNGPFVRPSLPDSHSSFGMSSLEVADPEEEEDATKDPREWIQIISAFDQPRLTYNVGKKHFERLVLTQFALSLFLYSLDA